MKYTAEEVSRVLNIHFVITEDDGTVVFDEERGVVRGTEDDIKQAAQNIYETVKESNG